MLGDYQIYTIQYIIIIYKYNNNSHARLILALLRPHLSPL